MRAAEDEGVAPRVENRPKVAARDVNARSRRGDQSSPLTPRTNGSDRCARGSPRLITGQHDVKELLENGRKALQKLADKVMALPGVESVLKPKVDGLMQKLSEIAAA